MTVLAPECLRRIFINVGELYTADYYISALDSALEFEKVRRSKETQNESCRFLRLPPELRNDIYRLIFGPLSNESYGVMGGLARLMFAYMTSRGILNSCRAIHNEAEGLFWASHIIELGHSIGLWIRSDNGLRLLQTAFSNAVASFQKIGITAKWARCGCEGGTDWVELVIDRGLENVVAWSDPRCRMHFDRNIMRLRRCSTCIARWQSRVKSWTHKIENSGIVSKDKKLCKNDLWQVVWTIAYGEDEERQAKQDRRDRRLTWIVIGIVVSYFALAILAAMTEECGKHHREHGEILLRKDLEKIRAQISRWSKRRLAGSTVV